MDMIGHDDERMKQELSLVAIVEERLLKYLRRGRHLKQAAALGRDGRYEISACFLGRKPHA